MAGHKPSEKKKMMYGGMMERKKKVYGGMMGRKKKKAGSKGKTVVSNTPKAKVRTAKEGGMIRDNHKGCGAVMGNRRKKTLYVRGTKNG